MKSFNSRVLPLSIAIFSLIAACNKVADKPYFSSDYSGVYKNVAYTYSFLAEFKPGVYYESQISDELRQMKYGRIEISFRYEGGGISSYMPLFYFGSINKNPNDNAWETKFHKAIEIGHYNVIPVPVEYLFYTISTFREPQYCRDTWSPVIAGTDYTLSIDKRPDGAILQLKRGDTIVSAFPHAFFPDSSQMFFNDVSNYIEANKGDSLNTVLMVGKGFAGFDNGIHNFNGQVNTVRIYACNLSEAQPDYELENIKNQLTENEGLSYSLIDPVYGENEFVKLNYEFQPYNFSSGKFAPSGEKQFLQSELFSNKKSRTIVLKKTDIGLYKISPQTIGTNSIVLKTSNMPFEIWVYPKEWYFISY